MDVALLIQVLVGVVLPFGVGLLAARCLPSLASVCQRLCAERPKRLTSLGSGAMVGGFVGLLALGLASEPLFTTYEPVFAVLMAAGAVCSGGGMMSFAAARSGNMSWPHLPVTAVTAGAVCGGCVVWAMAVTVY